MNAKPRIAVVGYGAIGRHHARNLAEMESADFVGVVDPNAKERDAARSAGHRCFPSIESLLGRVDAAIVAVPTSLHHSISADLMNAGIAVLIEKPIASNLHEAQDLIAIAGRQSLPLMIGYVERFNPAVLTAQKIMQDGLIGMPLQVSTRRVGTMPPRVRDANVIVDIGVHDIDIVSFLLQSNIRLVGAQGGMALIEDRLDYATLTMDAAGVAATVSVNWITPVKIRDLMITGSAGFLQVDYLSQRAYFAPGRDFVVTESYEDFIAQYEEGQLLECPVTRQEPLRLELEKFVAVLNGAPYPKPEIALESLRIAMEATQIIERSMRVGAAS